MRWYGRTLSFLQLDTRYEELEQSHLRSFAEAVYWATASGSLAGEVAVVRIVEGLKLFHGLEEYVRPGELSGPATDRYWGHDGIQALKAVETKFERPD